MPFAQILLQKNRVRYAENKRKCVLRTNHQKVDFKEKNIAGVEEKHLIIKLSAFQKDTILNSYTPSTITET